MYYNPYLHRFFGIGQFLQRWIGIPAGLVDMIILITLSLAVMVGVLLLLRLLFAGPELHRIKMLEYQNKYLREQLRHEQEKNQQLKGSRS